MFGFARDNTPCIRASLRFDFPAKCGGHLVQAKEVVGIRPGTNSGLAHWSNSLDRRMPRQHYFGNCQIVRAAKPRERAVNPHPRSPKAVDSVEKLGLRSSGGVSTGEELIYSVVLSFLFPSLLYLINPLGRVAFDRGVPYAVQRVGAGSRCVSHRASRFRFWAVAAK